MLGWIRILRLWVLTVMLVKTRVFWNVKPRRWASHPTFRHFETSGTTRQTTRLHIATHCNAIYVLRISSGGEEAETGAKISVLPNDQAPGLRPDECDVDLRRVGYEHEERRVCGYACARAYVIYSYLHSVCPSTVDSSAARWC
jgi:hypothetical protein